MFSFDAPVVLFLNSYAHVHPLVGYLTIFFAVYLAYALVLGLILFVFKDRHHHKVSKRGQVGLIAILAGLLARYVVKTIIVLLYLLERPYVALKDITLLIAPVIAEEQQTFPSGHALFFFALATVLFCYNKKLGVLYYIAAFLMSIARVAAGAHYPSDVAIGAIIGIVTGLLCAELIPRSAFISSAGGSLSDSHRGLR